ncbi:MAG: hypothetical protein QNK15_00790 [Cycloclasticus sp.]|nr:hypothetical protein [Cycloclasticus sp.]
MKTNLLMILLLAFITTPILAAKPDWTGQGKPDKEQTKQLKSTMKADKDMGKMKGQPEEKMAKLKEKKDKPDKLKGLEKQTEMKSTQQQKELDKGSEKGMESREERKKWWNFFGE